MFVARLWDQDVRRDRANALVPDIPAGVARESECEDPALTDWIIRFSSYEAACRASLAQPARAARIGEAEFSARVQACVAEANRLAEECSVSKSRLVLLVCKACKSEDVDKQEKQTRSADEGATGFYRCNSCGKQWKVEG